MGGWVREFEWDPIRWRLPIPPTVAAQMDEGQRWALSAARRALMDAGWPKWSIDSDRVAVILGNAIGGEKHYKSSMRIQLPEALKRLQESATLRVVVARGAASRSSKRPGPTTSTTCSRSPKTRCPASSPTSSRAGSPTS
ncbi:MAG: beta-ketoacyl synthase N-terminal-like domain-containing protein [Dermatophilaceae bacterium]